MTYIEQLHLDAMGWVTTIQAAKNSAEITEQIACDFQEWINNVQDKMYYEYDGKAIYNVKELFQEYLKSKENDK